MTLQPEKAWAAVCLTGYPRPFIHSNLVRDRQRPIREAMGMAWAREGETWQRGWRRAKQNGWRVQRVEVRAI